jgi:hypothetical protein
MKKKVIAATLAILSSSSAFAEKDSFSMGIGTGCLIPIEEKKFSRKALESFGKNMNKNSMFFISPYIGYNVTEEICVGITGMIGVYGYQNESDVRIANFDTEGDPKILNKIDEIWGVYKSHVPHSFDPQQDLGQYSLTHPLHLRYLNPAREILNDLSSKHKEYNQKQGKNMDPISHEDKILEVSLQGIEAILSWPLTKMHHAYNGVPLMEEFIRRQKESELLHTTYHLPFLSTEQKHDSLKCVTDAINIAHEIVRSINVMRSRYSTRTEQDQEHFPLVFGQKLYLRDTVKAMNNVKEHLLELIEEDALGKSRKAEAAKKIYNATPKMALLTTDVKVFTNDVVSLSVGGGMGVTHWSYTMGDNHSDQGWAIAGKLHGSVSLNLSDMANLNFSLGYTHLGNPKDKRGTGTVDLSSKIGSNVTGSISISKDF